MERKSAFAEVAGVVGTLLRQERSVESRSTDSRATNEAAFNRVGIASVTARNMRSRVVTAETMTPVNSRFDLNFEHRVVRSDYHVEGSLRRFEVLAGVSNWALEYM